MEIINILDYVYIPSKIQHGYWTATVIAEVKELKKRSFSNLYSIGPSRKRNMKSARI